MAADLVHILGVGIVQGRVGANRVVEILQFLPGQLVVGIDSQDSLELVAGLGVFSDPAVALGQSHGAVGEVLLHHTPPGLGSETTGQGAEGALVALDRFFVISLGVGLAAVIEEAFRFPRRFRPTGNLPFLDAL